MITQFIESISGGVQFGEGALAAGERRSSLAQDVVAFTKVMTYTIDWLSTAVCGDVVKRLTAWQGREERRHNGDGHTATLRLNWAR